MTENDLAQYTQHPTQVMIMLVIKMLVLCFTIYATLQLRKAAR